LWNVPPTAAAIRRPSGSRLNLPPDEASKLRPVHLAALGLALAVAAVVRFQLARGVPPWFAEIYVLRVCTQSFGEMMRLARADIGPPFPLMLRWVWTHLGGDGALWQKSFSILYALASMLFTFVVARRVFGTAAALLAIALLALHPAHIQYSQEIDDYSLTWLTISAMIAAAWAWSERASRRGAVLYVLAAVFAIYSDYVTLLVWPVTAIAVGILLPKSRGSRRSWWLLNLIVLACFLPYLPTWLEQLARESYGRYWRFPGRQALTGVWTTLGFGSRWALLVMLPLAVAPLFRAATRRFAIVLWAVLLLTPFSTRVWVVLLPREVLFLVPLLLMLVAGGIAAIPARVPRTALTLLLLALAARGGLRLPRFAEAVATGRAADFVAAHAERGDLVVHAEPHSLFSFLYAHPTLRSRLLREPGDRLPFFEGGLAVPESLYLSSSEWRAERAGHRWWGVWVDRALATKGRVWRAGAAQAESLRAAAGDSLWHDGPVTVWEGRDSAP
jgi:hypothetical protein